MKVPTGETLVLTYTDSGNVFYITTNQARTLYYGYKESDDGKLVKLGRAKTPTEVEVLFKVENKTVKRRTKKVD